MKGKRKVFHDIENELAPKICLVWENSLSIVENDAIGMTLIRNFCR